MKVKVNHQLIKKCMHQIKVKYNWDDYIFNRALIKDCPMSRKLSEIIKLKSIIIKLYNIYILLLLGCERKKWFKKKDIYFLFN